MVLYKRSVFLSIFLIFFGFFLGCLEKPGSLQTGGEGSGGTTGGNGDEDLPSPVGDLLFPRTMAFRPEEDLDVASGDYSSLKNYSLIQTENKSLFEDLVASSLFHEKLKIYHAGHAVVSASYRDEVFPGHWLFEKGTLITKKVKEADTSLEVEEGTALKEGDYAMISYRKKANAKREWDVTEEVVIKKIKGNTLEVERGQYGTKAQIWAPDHSPDGGKEIAITPHVYMSLSDQTEDWSLNVSLASPKNLEGLTGWEFYAQWAYDFYYVGKMGETGDGLEFDSGRWGFDSTKFPVDVDNDGEADYGIVKGVNVYGLGASLYIELLRKKLPKDFLLLIDSPPHGYRNPANLNGVETESFPFLEDYTKFSSGITHLANWVANAEEKTKFTYGFTKDDTQTFQCDPDAAEDDKSYKETDAHFRVGFATSLVLGMPHPYAAETLVSNKKCFGLFLWDEYFGGDLNDWVWLKKPYGDLIRYSDDLGDENLLEGVTWLSKDKNSLTAMANDYKYEVEIKTASLSLEVTKVPEKVEERLTGGIFPNISGVYFQTSGALPQTKAKEFTVTFSAKAKSFFGDYETLGDFGKIPRLLNVKMVAGGESYEQSVLVWNEKTDYSLSFRVGNKAMALDSLALESGEETGSITIENVELYTGGNDRWVRYFEGGAVLLNMTGTDWVVDLDTQYSPSGFSRLKGTQDTKVNNGEAGDGEKRNQFTVPAEDALVVKTNS